MMPYALIFVGGGLGSMARFAISQWVYRWAATGFPWGTLSVNVIGCGVIGALGSLFDEGVLVEPNMRTFLMIGVLGGYTTFSSFGLEAWNLFREQQWISLAAYIGASNVAGLSAVVLGWTLVRMVVRPI